MANQPFFSITLLAKQKITSNILEIRFIKPAGFFFLAGQFVQFQIPEGEKYVLRSFSLSSAPHHDYLEFCVKILPEGKASLFFEALPIGEAVLISAARGRFVCDTAGPNYFIATGTGLAPIMSIVHHLVKTKEPPLSVLFGVRHAEDLFWVERLESLRAKNPNLLLQITLSRPTENWSGLRGRVSEHVSLDPQGHYYICGSLEMVKDVRAILLNAGVSVKNIHQEIY